MHEPMKKSTKLMENYWMSATGELAVFLVTYVPDPFHPSRQRLVQDAGYDARPDDDDREISSKVPQQHLPHRFGEHIGVWPPELPCPSSLTETCHVLVIIWTVLLVGKQQIKMHNQDNGQMYFCSNEFSSSHSPVEAKLLHGSSLSLF